MSKGPLLGLVLTAMAGWVDAIGFLQLGGFYPSFMSGNTTQLGIALSNGNWQAAMLPALLIGLFVTGVFAAAAIADSVMRWRLPSCFLLETFVLAAAMLFSAAQPELTVALAPLAFAMGLQNVTARRFSQPGLGITFVTGTLVRLGEALAGRALGRSEPSPFLPGLTWVAMAAGAVAGAAAHVAFGAFALAMPACCSALATVLAASAAAPTHGNADAKAD
jgi:uncharacterized membrane protein YoaK (UPF0700 family)